MDKECAMRINFLAIEGIFKPYIIVGSIGVLI